MPPVYTNESILDAALAEQDLAQEAVVEARQGQVVGRDLLKEAIRQDRGPAEVLGEDEAAEGVEIVGGEEEEPSVRHGRLADRRRANFWKLRTSL